MARSVGVFVSSTFRDMQAERDYLVTVVFPELKERLDLLGLELNDIDLRWGVPDRDADGELANSWEYCKKAIDRIEPFFVGVLGDRYGHVPDPQRLVDGRDRQRWEGRSITEMEIRHATEDVGRRAFFYLREIAPGESPAHAVPSWLLDPEHTGAMGALKAYLPRTGRPVRTYVCRWNPGLKRVDRLDEFGAAVLEDLWSGVLREPRYVPETHGQAERRGDFRDGDDSTVIPEHVWKPLLERVRPDPSDPWIREQERMEAFAEGRLRWFQGRAEELERLRGFIERETRDQVCVVTGPPGQGKSALLARLAIDLAESPHAVLAHFVGSTEESGEVRALLARLNRWVEREGLPSPAGTDPHPDLRTLKDALARSLKDYDGERRLVVLIDALNQLTGGHELSWLPVELGPRVRIIVSCVESSLPTGPEADVLAALGRRRPEPEWIVLAELDQGSVGAIVRQYFDEYSKELGTEQIAAIRRTPQAGNPLYLRVLLDQLRVLGGDDMQQKVPALLARIGQERPDTVSLFDWVLEGLEGAFGRDPVGAWCTYLTLGRVGMSSAELSDLLTSRFDPETGRNAYRIERGIRRYLQRRSAQLDFFHGQLRSSVARRYEIADATDRGAEHALIADTLERRWRRRTADRHALSELAYHVVKARQWEKVLSVLDDAQYVGEKVAQLGPEALIEDFELAYGALQGANPALAARLVDVLGQHLNRQEAIGEGTFNLENVNASRQYAADGSLLEALLRWSDASARSGAALTSEYVTLSRVYLAELLRRRNDFDEALAIVDSMPGGGSPRELKVLSLAKYQAGYVHFLRDHLDSAIRLMRESADCGARSPDEVGAWISRCVLARFEWLSGATSSDEAREVLGQARGVFERHASHDPRARRWRVHNVEGQLLGIAFAEGDARRARQAWEAIVQDAWEASIDRDTSALWNSARLAMLEGRWDAAIRDFVSIPKGAAEPWLDLDRETHGDRTEALSEYYLEFGTALRAAGSSADAQRAWQRGLECPDEAGNLIWKRKIRERMAPGVLDPAPPP